MGYIRNTKTRSVSAFRECITVPWFSSTLGRPPVLLLEHPGLPIQARIAAVSISTAVWAIFLKSRYSTDCSL